MQFATRDREYTAQILKRGGNGYSLNGWKIVGHTTIVIHEPSIPPSKWSEDLAAFRRQMMYGAGVTYPKMNIFKGNYQG